MTRAKERFFFSNLLTEVLKERHYWHHEMMDWAVDTIDLSSRACDEFSSMRRQMRYGSL